MPSANVNVNFRLRERKAQRLHPPYGKLAQNLTFNAALTDARHFCAGVNNCAALLNHVGAAPA
jgi:hypothetical protein